MQFVYLVVHGFDAAWLDKLPTEEFFDILKVVRVMDSKGLLPHQRRGATMGRGMSGGRSN